jgi:arsenate reductase (glutaredoxin)
MLKIYHNPKCRKSRAGLAYLQEKGQEVEVIEYLKKPFTEKDFELLLAKLNKRPGEMVRTQEEYYKKKLKGKNFHDHEWIRILLENPKLLQRPIVEAQYRAVIGDPVENMDKLIK